MSDVAEPKKAATQPDRDGWNIAASGSVERDMKRLIVIGLIGLAACSPASQDTNPIEPRSRLSETQLEAEYEFEPYPGSRWYGPNGNEISQESNIINAITGPDHCEWQSAVMMHIGWPLGHDAADASESRQYLRDPEGVFARDSLMTTFDPNTPLPSGAEYTRYRTDFMELWLDETDDAAAYLVFADHAERWPRAEEPIACA